MSETKAIKKFPLRLDQDFSRDIDACVYHLDYPSKHQYILDAIKEKMDRDKKMFDITK